MAKKKVPVRKAESLPPAEITMQPITETIEKNFMPYAMSVIISRAIPEIDGFKPAHRKLLYTMYKMGLLTGERTKSANVVGRTMHLNPHGDQAIYRTLVRLTRGNEALLHPFIDSKGSFGKYYSSDMAFAASRYTEVKLDRICNEIFRGIDRNAVDFTDNYDNTTKEPVLLPTAFPNILVSPNLGVAVGMASNICSFNLAEICDGAIAMMRDPSITPAQMLDIVTAPDFPGGADYVYDRGNLEEIYATGRGKLMLRSKYKYDKDAGCIDILEIPYSTSIEEILNKITDMVKTGRLREITDFRDAIDLHGFKLTLDLRRGTDPELLMAKLFKSTSLLSSFDCNFNILIDGTPRQMGLCEILAEWIKFRVGCVRRELTFELERKQDKLHLLLGLGKILLDIDRAIKIIRETQLEKDVVPNLMEGFDIDRIQAEYIAEIKLRYLNREYIINRIKEIEILQKEIADLEKTVASDNRIKKVITGQLEEIKTKYGQPRRTGIIQQDSIKEFEEKITVENYNVRLTFTSEGYFKKLSPQSLKASDEHKLKEGDIITTETDAENIDELLFFSDRAQVYKAKVSDFETTKASALGEYIPVKLGFDDGEKAIAMVAVHDYANAGNIVFIFKNGKGVRIPVSAYQTKTNRKKLTAAYSDAAPIAGIIFEREPKDILMVSDGGRAILISTRLITEKTSRSSQGQILFTLKKGQALTRVTDSFDQIFAKRYRKNKLPSTGLTVEEFDF